MEWRNIPSLSALRAFEAAARLTSFSAAARDLNVTHAAISQHVRALEAEFGCALLVRRGRKMALTPEGQELAQSLSDGFSTIAGGIQDLRNRNQDRPLVISLTPLFAENWLMPRLRHFWDAHPEISLSLQPSLALSDLRRDNIDLAIRYGDGDWPSLDIDKLTPVSFIAIGRPELFDDPTNITQQDLQSQQWFFESYRPEYRRWAEEAGAIGPNTRTVGLETNQLVLAAARQSYGVCIQVKALVEPDLQSGAMIPLLEGVGDQSTLGYYIVTRKGDPSENLRLFRKWLMSQS
jgi:LysR family glycine cleavage system transcriptional activator